MQFDSIKTPFFDLPGEIRNTIYKYCFGDLAFHYCSPDFIKDARRFTNTKWSTTLFSVNHQVRQEALSAFSDNLTVFSDYADLLVRPLQHPKFILANVSKLVVCEDLALSLPRLKINIVDWRRRMPKLETLSILLCFPIPTLHKYWGIDDDWTVPQISSSDDLIIFLRGSTERNTVLEHGYHRDDSMEEFGFDGMTEDNFRLMWKVETKCVMKNLHLRHLYRIDFAPATWTIHTRRINVSQSRSYLFGTWVPAESVTLLIDEVSFPVVWSVKHNMGRVLTNRVELIQKVEEQLEDSERLARALEKGFSCANPLDRKQKRLICSNA